MLRNIASRVNMTITTPSTLRFIRTLANRTSVNTGSEKLVKRVSLRNIYKKHEETNKLLKPVSDAGSAFLGFSRIISLFAVGSIIVIVNDIRYSRGKDESTDPDIY
jgi:hypothetical protein